ncbi:MAG: transposase [Bacteroidetes bacterium]|jgi:REP element-mobilizing transposase RayT|nr:transposase [Bacteroidota bacterium]
MTKFKNKYRIESARLQNWDYGWNASYFITICTQQREHYFGEIENNEMILSEMGRMAEKFWHEIPKHFPFTQLDAFVVMPNHVHGIIVIDKNGNDGGGNGDGHGNGGGDGNGDGHGNVETRQCLVSTTNPTANPTSNPTTKTIGQKRFQNQGKNTLSSIIGSYKSVVTKNARIIHADFGWQSRFHDHIIRDDASYQRIKNYIINNPKKWNDDKFNNYNSVN